MVEKLIKIQVLMTMPETKVFVNKLYNQGIGFTADELTVLNQIKAEVTDNICWNTKIYKNEKVVCLIGDTTLIELGDIITTYNFDWVIMAASDGYEWDEGEQVYIKKILKKFKFNDLKKFLIDETVLNGEERVGKFMRDVILEGED